MSSCLTRPQMSAYLRQRSDTATQTDTETAEDAAAAGPPAVQRRHLGDWFRAVLAAAVWLAMGGHYSSNKIWLGIRMACAGASLPACPVVLLVAWWTGRTTRKQQLHLLVILYLFHSFIAGVTRCCYAKERDSGQVFLGGVLVPLKQ